MRARRAGQSSAFRTAPTGLAPYYNATQAIDVDSAAIAGTLTDPAHLSPSLHTHADEQLPWFEMLDNLPRYAQGSRGQTPMRYGPREMHT
jgi:hypothetical protein